MFRGIFFIPESGWSVYRQRGFGQKPRPREKIRYDAIIPNQNAFSLSASTPATVLGSGFPKSRAPVAVIT